MRAQHRVERKGKKGALSDVGPSDEKPENDTDDDIALNWPGERPESPILSPS